MLPVPVFPIPPIWYWLVKRQIKLFDEGVDLGDPVDGLNFVGEQLEAINNVSIGKVTRLPAQNDAGDYIPQPGEFNALIQGSWQGNMSEIASPNVLHANGSNSTISGNNDFEFINNGLYTDFSVPDNTSVTYYVEAGVTAVYEQGYNGFPSASKGICGYINRNNVFSTYMVICPNPCADPYAYIHGFFEQKAWCFEGIYSSIYSIKALFSMRKRNLLDTAYTRIWFFSTGHEPGSEETGMALSWTLNMQNITYFQIPPV